MATIEVTDDMIEAGLDAVNKLRMVEADQTGEQRVEMSWADLLSVAYAAMETCRQRQLSIRRATDPIYVPFQGLIS